MSQYYDNNKLLIIINHDYKLLLRLLLRRMQLVCNYRFNIKTFFCKKNILSFFSYERYYDLHDTLLLLL